MKNGTKAMRRARRAALHVAKQQNARQRNAAKVAYLECASVPIVLRRMGTARPSGEVPVPVAIQSWLARRKLGSKV